MARLENALKKYLVRVMGTRWDVQSHEDKLTSGIPDLSYGAGGVNGWIELKHVREWPSRPSTTIDLSHFTASQVNWLIKRGKKAGNCWVLVQVATEYFLFPFSSARALRAGVTEERFREMCFQCWPGRIEPDQLLEKLVGAN